MTKATTSSTSKTNNHTVVGDSIRNAGERIDEFTQHAADKSDDMIHQGQDAIYNVQKEIEKYSDSAIVYIKKYPLKSALIAGGIGMLLGKLFTK